MAGRRRGVDAIRERIERRRELRRLEEEALRQGRIPPGQALTVKWPVLHATGPNGVSRASWTLKLFGLVDESCTLTWDAFASLPRITRVSDVHCVTRWTKLDNTWEGVAVSEVLRYVALRPEAQFVLVHAPGYTANLPLSALLDDDVLFAYRHDGEDLAREHGGPVRLVVPKRYFWKSVKWVTGLEFLAEDRPGFWEVRGYHNDGDPWAEERFSPF
jgi:DMSO/TMAO reductase YedYZ molybdopterin-dependent catalytic subunit